MSTGNSHAAKMKRQHQADMSRIGREKAEKYRKEQRRAILNKRPDQIKVFDRQIYRLKFLGIASKAMNGKPGSLRQEYEKLAGPGGLTTRKQYGVEYWTAPPKNWKVLSVFHSHFGMPGEPAGCKDAFGLTGHLFDDATKHDPANVRQYAENWIAELERQRAVERQKYVTQIHDRNSGVTQINGPSW